jgi:hypothetical protein
MNKKEIRIMTVKEIFKYINLTVEKVNLCEDGNFKGKIINRADIFKDEELCNREIYMIGIDEDNSSNTIRIFLQ